MRRIWIPAIVAIALAVAYLALRRGGSKDDASVERAGSDNASRGGASRTPAEREVPAVERDLPPDRSGLEEVPLAPLPPDDYEPAKRPEKVPWTPEELARFQEEDLRVLERRLAALDEEIATARADGDVARVDQLEVRKRRYQETLRMRRDGLDAGP